MLPKELYKYFWDVDPGKIDLHKHARYIIERILEYGDLESFWWLQKKYEEEIIVDVCRTSRSVSDKSKNFWLLWLGVEKEIEKGKGYDIDAVLSDADELLDKLSEAQEQAAKGAKGSTHP